MHSKGEISKEKIIAKVTPLVRRQGFSATSISEVVTASGMKKGSLYFHFSGKEELSLCILERARKDFLVFLDCALTGKTPGGSLDRFFHLVLQKHRKSNFVGGCIFGNTALEMSDKDQRIAAVISEVFSSWVKKLKKVVKAAQAAGQVRDDLSAEVMARHIVLTIEGGIMLARLEKKEKPLKDCLQLLRTMMGLKK